MNIQDKIDIINNAVELYFKQNPGQHSVKPNELCLAKLCVVRGLACGKQIRDVLRKLDSLNQLDMIPTLSVDRMTAKRNWSFLNMNRYHNIDNEHLTFTPLGSKAKNKDEHYVLDLCDKVLKLKSSRQHKFDFLLGDSGVKLPVDAYYKELNIVIEYRERQHTEGVPFFDKPDKMTVSGVHRREQRKIYDQRRRDVLHQYGITLIEISYSDFNYDSKKRINRNENSDIYTITNILDKHIQ